MISAAQNNLIDAALAPAAIGQQISAAVAVKARDAEKQEGAEVLELLDGASQAGDPLVAKATGLGTLLDVTG